jgi:hypothetical protein
MNCHMCGNNVDNLPDEGELIVSSAVRTTDGLLFTGMRHDECLKAIYHSYGLKKHIGSEQGFVTNQCRFLNRKQAYIFAIQTGQIEPYLISETIWPLKGGLF